MALCSFVSSLPMLLLILLCFSGSIDTTAEWTNRAVSQSTYTIKVQSRSEQALLSKDEAAFLGRRSRTFSQNGIDKVHLMDGMAIEVHESRSLADVLADDYTPAANPSLGGTPPPP